MGGLPAAVQFLKPVRSPLRYPGGKSRAVRSILQYVPLFTGEVVSPFLGGASVELVLEARGVRVFGGDLFGPLASFWVEVLRDPGGVADRVEGFLPLSRERFYQLQDGFSDITDPVLGAAVFYVLNRSSFSGTTLSGGMSPSHPRFNRAAIERLRGFYASNLSVVCQDYEATLGDHPGVLAYLDPPYMVEGGLYGVGGSMHDGFDHIRLADVLRERDSWVLSYNDTGMVRDLYIGYRIVELSWSYGMNRSRRSSELLILNC